MRKFRYRVVVVVIVLGMVAKFFPEIRNFYNNSWGKCVESANQVAQLQKDRVQHLKELLDEIK